MLAFYLSLLSTEEEQTAFTRFYERYQQVMFFAARDVLRDEGLAEDATQEAFLWFVKNLDKIADVESSHSYAQAVTVSKHIAIDMLRKQDKRKEDLWEEAQFSHSAYAAKEERPESEGAVILEKLPDLYGTILLLKGLGYTPAEIARIRNTPIQTVYKQIARGKELLLQVMDKEGYNGF